MKFQIKEVKKAIEFIELIKFIKTIDIEDNSNIDIVIFL